VTGPRSGSGPAASPSSSPARLLNAGIRRWSGSCAAKGAERVTEPEAARLRQLGEELQRSVAHAADFVWRAGGAVALAASRGDRVKVLCLTYGERGESASAWRAGKTLEEIKALRRGEAEGAAAALGAEIDFLDAGDYPLRESDELVDRIVRVYREVNPSVVLTHPLADPYNGDHPAAAQMALRARVLAQAVGYPAPGEPIGAPPVFLFEPHQPEMCGFKPEVLLDITPVFDAKRKAMDSGSLATATFPGVDGVVGYGGDTAIAGVPGTAAAVVLDFAGTEGSATSALLPTGHVTDVIDDITVTCIDNGMPVVVVPAAELGRTGYETVAELEADTGLGLRVRALQLAAGQLMGLGDVSAATVPKISLVAAPADGGTICTRTFIPVRVHDSIGVLGAVSVATALLLDGAAGGDLAAVKPGQARFDIEHPTGHVEVEVDQTSQPSTVLRSGVVRTARKLFEGTVFPRRFP
jgi:4-oxalomesaconate hydratase